MQAETLYRTLIYKQQNQLSMKSMCEKNRTDFKIIQANQKHYDRANGDRSSKQIAGRRPPPLQKESLRENEKKKRKKKKEFRALRWANRGEMGRGHGSSPPLPHSLPYTSLPPGCLSYIIL